jgi:hypothetical protein
MRTEDAAKLLPGPTVTRADGVAPAAAWRMP